MLACTSQKALKLLTKLLFCATMKRQGGDEVKNRAK